MVSVAAAAAAGFLAGLVVMHLASRRHRRLRIDWQLIVDSDENPLPPDGG